jgi:quercetin dioxygenase-like cupin family protein
MESISRIRARYGRAVVAGVLAAAGAVVFGQGRPPSQSRVAIAQALPALDGQHLVASLVEVTYAPGGAGTPHRHPCPVTGYMLEGSMRMRVTGQPERTYTAGETFYEAPTDVHLISTNASADTPARFLAYFVCDHKTPLSVPASDAPVR